MIISKPNEDGVVFIMGKEHKYLVVYRIEGKLTEPVIETAREIFNKMDMDDCYDIEIVKIHLLEGDTMSECWFRGTWHNPKEPLKMKIVDLKTHEVYDVGYGTDH